LCCRDCRRHPTRKTSEKAETDVNLDLYLKSEPAHLLRLKTVYPTRNMAPKIEIEKTIVARADVPYEGRACS